MNADRDIIVMTGCSGRVGTKVMGKFKNGSYQIIGLDIVPPSNPPPNFEYIKMDISSKESVQKAFQDIHKRYGDRIASVIHLAAYYNFTGGEWNKYENITIDGTDHALEALKNFRAEQFIFSSTMLVLAPANPPQKINENSPLVSEPWEYPRSKIETEKLIQQKHGNIPILLLRIAGCYDDECHSIPISNQIQRIYEKQFASQVFPGDVTHGASYLHLDDLADAIWLAVQKRRELPNELTLLVGEDETLSYDQLQRQVSRLIHGKEFKTYQIPKWFAKIGAWVQDHTPLMQPSFIKPWMIKYADDNYNLDLTRIKQHLGWKPKRSLRETLPKMTQDLKANPLRWYKMNNLNAPSWLKKSSRSP